MIPVIPKPLEISVRPGSFNWTEKGFTIRASAPEDSAARLLQERIRIFTSLPCTLESQIADFAAPGLILLEIKPVQNLPETGYEMDITQNSIRINAPSREGLLSGCASLAQILANQSPGSFEIPCLNIRDWPRFCWRGMHLDVCRHYMPVEFIKKYLDIMSLYKLNMFHWHLTEDQGWRVEIKKYPRLTEIGAWRTPVGFEHNQKIGLNVDNGGRYGGFYSHDEIREIVAYARARGITVVPEIEMPGHSSAALAAYPQFGCTGGPYEVLTEAAVSRDIYCAGREQTFTFLTDVLEEVLDLFDSEYIHVGGDEVPKHAWEDCPLCQKRIREQGLENEEQLGRYFMSRIETFLNARGRKLIGWDEILEGGLTENATVMSWRGFEGGIAAARQGHDSVITPSPFTYFNFRQDKFAYGPGHPWYLPLEKVYSFDPVPEEVSPENARHILGGQGCLWTEYIPKPEHAEYLLLPRLCALSEALWLDTAEKDFQDFQMRLAAHHAMLDQMDLNYYIPVVEGFCRYNVFVDSMECELINPGGKGEIYYTIDGDPHGARRYQSPIQVDSNMTLRAWVDTDGMSGMVRVGTFEKQPFRPGIQKNGLTPGLACTVFEGDFYECSQIGSGTKKVQRVCENFKNPIEEQDNYGLLYEGFFHAPRKGVYRFFTKSRHGSRLYIGEKKVVDNDGRHSAFEHSGQAALDEGFHPIRVEYFKRDLHYMLEVSVESGFMEKQLLNFSMLFH